MSNNKEKSLITSLKLNYNPSSKSEIDLEKSSQIFHKLGLLYKQRSHIKICLIQSAALLVAARIRSSGNKQKIQNDLESVWHLVLHKAKAKRNYIALRNQTKIVEKRIQRMRTNIEKTSNDIPRVDKLLFYNTKIDETTKRKIDKVRFIQEQITDDYLTIMKCLARRCIEILGEASCKFALVGLGSLARKEVTPYSDFECIIVLEEGVQNTKTYQHTLEYFRWFAVIFQVVLISLGETILPSVAIPSLNDFHKKSGNWFYDDVAPNGISFDGFMPHACKTPLGRQHATKNKPWKTELIKPVSEMLKFLGSEEDLKNGYHLADILTQTCFVFGDEDVYGKFENGITCELEQQQSNETQFFDQLNRQVAEDKYKFDPENLLQRLLVFNLVSVKSAFYRSITIFVSALGKFYHMKSKSSFEIVDDLTQIKTFSETDADKLKYAIAIACEARLKVYQTFKKQNDQIDDNLEIKNAASPVVNAVGKASIYDYCLIAQALQENLPLLKAENRNFQIELCQKTNGYYFENFFLNRFFLKFLFWANFLLYKRWVLCLNIAVMLVSCFAAGMKTWKCLHSFAYILLHLAFCSFFHSSSLVFFNDSNLFRPFFSLAHRNFYRNFFSTVATSKTIITEIFKKCNKSKVRKTIYFFRMLLYYVKVFATWLIFSYQIIFGFVSLIDIHTSLQFKKPWYCSPLFYVYWLLSNHINHLDVLIFIKFCVVVSISMFQYYSYYRLSLINIAVIVFLSVFLFFIVGYYIQFTLLLLSLLCGGYGYCVSLLFLLCAYLLHFGHKLIPFCMDIFNLASPHLPDVLCYVIWFMLNLFRLILSQGKTAFLTFFKIHIFVSDFRKDCSHIFFSLMPPVRTGPVAPNQCFATNDT